MVARYRDASAPDWDFIAEPVHMRARIVRDLAAWGLAARDLSEAIARVRFQLEHDMLGGRETEALLRDLQSVQAKGASGVKPASPGQSRTNGRKDRRANVERILATREGQSLSLRQIAERAGVSPATVLNVKREKEQSALQI
jgi:hypothetical protein